MEKLKSMIETWEYQEQRCECLDVKTGLNPFVTISREAGAGGHTLALAILKELKKEESNPLFRGWNLCNQEICRKMAEDPELSVSVESLLKNEYRSALEDMLKELIAGESPQDRVIRKMFKQIRVMAGFGKVVLVGRGGACLTRDFPLGIHLRLVAPEAVRVKRMQELLQVSEKQARETMHEQDKGRAKLIGTWFNKDIRDPLLYDAVWNTGKVPVEDIAKATVQLIRQRACHCRQPAVSSHKESHGTGI